MEKELFQVGVVVGVHGLRGDLKVRPLTEGSSALFDAAELWFDHADGRRERFVPQRCVQHKKNILLRLKGVEGINRVEYLVGCDVLMTYADLPETGDDEDYWDDLKGLAVTDRRRGELGTLEEIFTTAAHDIYVINGPFGEVMIPAVKQFVIEISQQDKTMLVDLPDGLVADIDAL